MVIFHLLFYHSWTTDDNININASISDQIAKELFTLVWHSNS